MGWWGWWGCVLLNHVPPHGMDVSLHATCDRASMDTFPGPHVTILAWTHPPMPHVTVLALTCPLGHMSPSWHGHVLPCHMSPSWHGHVLLGHVSSSMDMFLHATCHHPSMDVSSWAMCHHPWTCPSMSHVTVLARTCSPHATCHCPVMDMPLHVTCHRPGTDVSPPCHVSLSCHGHVRPCHTSPSWHGRVLLGHV